MIILGRDTVWNPSALDIANVPRRFIGRVWLLPRGRLGWRLRGRVIFETQLLRYLIALLPFVIAMLVWPDLALPIAQAPLVMIVAIGFVEMRLLHIPNDRRGDLVPDETAARILDTLRFRGTAILRKVAAARDMTGGELVLVVEQSELARILPLTYVSVQTRTPRPRLLDLTAAERDAVAASLFDAEMSERDLAAVNQRDKTFLRSVTFNARAVSAHARLSARLARPQADAATAGAA